MKLVSVIAAAAFIAAAPASAATVDIDPATGGSGSFAWENGLGPIDEIDGNIALDSATFGVTANAGDMIDASLFDCCVAGDQFELILNGVMLTPTSTTISGGLYNYFFENIVLAQGLNVFGINVTVGAPGYTSGGASYEFSAVMPGAGGAVPEPGTWAMMLLGFGGVGFAMRRAKRSAELLKLA